MTYQRVIPRDFFNEAKLLKCWGQLALKLHDGVKLPGWHEGVRLSIVSESDRGWAISQDPVDGALFLPGVDLHAIRGHRGFYVVLSTEYNSRDPYPMTINAIGERVFGDDGEWTDEAREYLAEGIWE